MQNKKYLFASLCIGLFVLNNQAYGMGLRSFVALPIEKNGAVLRMAFERRPQADIDILTTSFAYGISAKQSLFVTLPFRLFSDANNPQGDVSVLYRHILWQDDAFSGTNRLAFLGGMIVPGNKDRDAGTQAGFVFTHFKNRNEIDVDLLYQAGLGNRPDSGRFDISWQHRLLPTEYPEWGLVSELNTVLEINGRWQEGSNTTHQLTAGLQWIKKRWVFETGVIKDLNQQNQWSYLLSSRYHF
ncbi:MAG: hypothetical protein L3J52_01905 [Proteobacteria bacterium]|nr:hypothetical protein [Pseudomonadota bacterium]